MGRNILTRRDLLGRTVCAGALAVWSTLRAPALRAKAAVTEGLSRIRGRIIRRSDPDYERWRRALVWYVYKPKRYPHTIIRAETAQDAIEAVNYARAKGLKVAVRSSGHNPPCATLRDGGVLLDLGRLRDVEVDPETRTAWFGPGIRSAEFLERCERHGLAFPAAHTSMVGLGGYVLGGGLGWNLGEWDIACRSIVGAEVLLADGSRRRVTKDENADLLWAIRGVGPGFFGAVLRYQVRLFPAPKAKAKSTYIIPIERLPEVIAALQDIVPRKQDRLEILCILGSFHPPGTPRERRNGINCVITAFSFGNSPEEVEALTAPLVDSPLPDLSIFRREKLPMSFLQLYAGQQTDHTSPYRTAVTNVWTDDPGRGLGILAERLPRTPSRKSFALSVWGLNLDQDDADSSWTYFSDNYISWYAIADEEAHIARNAAWMDEAIAAMQPLSRGHYLNEIDPLHYPHHVNESFSKAKWQRLADMRRAYDPQGVFHTYLGHERG